MVSAGRIGGDFYDYVEGSDGALLCIVADVSGKGVPAALILSAFKVLFRSIASRTREPAAIAERLSSALHDAYSGMPYATAFVARFDGARRRLTYVNAGHPPGYVLRASGVIALESAGLPLGLLPDAAYADAAFDLDTGDVVVIVTDGVTEALETGSVTLAQALETVRDRVAGHGSPSAACDALLRAAGEGGGGPAGIEGWPDDRTVVVAVVDPRVRGGMMSLLDELAPSRRPAGDPRGHGGRRDPLGPGFGPSPPGRGPRLAGDRRQRL